MWFNWIFKFLERFLYELLLCCLMVKKKGAFNFLWIVLILAIIVSVSAYLKYNQETIQMSPSTHAGWVDGVDRNSCYVYGWACDQTYPNSAVNVILTVNGQVVAGAQANLGREWQVGAACGGSSAHGYKMTIPNRFKTGTPWGLRVQMTPMAASGKFDLPYNSNQAYNVVNGIFTCNLA